MKKSKKVILIAAILAACLFFMNFFLFKAQKPQESIEFAEGNIELSESNISIAETDLLDNDTISQQSVWILDTIKTYESKTDKWGKEKIINDLDQYIENDSIQINPQKAVLINIKDTLPYFQKGEFSFLTMELIDSFIDNSRHRMYKKKDEEWKLVKQTFFDFENPKHNKIEINYRTNETSFVEYKNTFYASMNNSISSSRVEHHNSGKVTYDTSKYATYDDQGILKSVIRQGKGNDGKTITFSKAVYEFTSEGLVSLILNYDRINSELVVSCTTSYRYDNNKNIVYKKVFCEDGSLNFAVNYTYNNQGKCVDQFYQCDDDGYNFVNKRFTYNHENQMIAYIHQNKMKQSEPYKTVESRKFEYNTKLGYLSKITENGKVTGHVLFDEYGNIVERNNTGRLHGSKMNKTFNYLIPYENLNTTFYENNRLVNTYVVPIANENGIKMSYIKKPFSHALATKTISRMSKTNELKIKEIQEFKYKEVSNREN